MPNKALEERFWERVDTTPGHGPKGDCWLWTKGTSSDGYGHFYVGMRNSKKHYLRAHRLAYSLIHGEIPEGLVVCHKCDQILCCNPNHLFLGTVADNAHDMFDKGRATIDRKLTESQVIELIKRYRAGEKSSVLAKEYGVSIDHVSRLHRGERWGHLQALINSQSEGASA